MNDVPEIIRQLRLIGYPTGLEAADALMELQRQKGVLREALDTYSKHFNSCNRWNVAPNNKCDCGLDAALSLLETK